MSFYLRDEMGHDFPVDIVCAETSKDGISEFTVRTKLMIPRKAGKSWTTTWATALRGFPSGIKKVIFHDPATIVLWDDGTKTVVKCQEDDEYSKEQGLALCIAKKHLGNKSNFNNEFKRWIHE